jgi:CubicO group peptidase (beta-lactamase class C family)
MKRTVLVLAALALAATTATSQDRAAARAALIARAKALELNTPYVPPPGDALQHHASGYAKIMCSAVFITGLHPDFAAENVGGFTSPFGERAKVGKPVIDRDEKAVHITLPNGVTRAAKYVGSQGCVTLPIGQKAPHFKPVSIVSKLPNAATTPWPMGDMLPKDGIPAGVDAAKLKQAIDAAFEPATGMTAAFVVTWKGRLIGERYGEGITDTTALESWSMGKSVTATLMGILIKDGVYKLTQAAPIPEWQTPGDPRAKITIADILHMSSGLRIRRRRSGLRPVAGLSGSLYSRAASTHSATRRHGRCSGCRTASAAPQHRSRPHQLPHSSRRRKRGEDYLSFPLRALFDRIGVRTMVMETDPFGNFLTQGYEFASGRDWARLGNLYLQDGVWNGQRILPEGYAKFVSTIAPAWEADKRPIYGGFFWINGEGTLPVPKEAYYMSGAGGQTTLIIPSHDLVVVRLGHYRGASAGGASFRKALALLMEAVPAR